MHWVYSEPGDEALFPPKNKVAGKHERSTCIHYVRSLLGSGSSGCAGLDLQSTRLGGVVSAPADLDPVLMGLQMQIRYVSARRWHLGALADGHVLLELIHSSVYLCVHSLISAMSVSQHAVCSGTRCVCVHVHQSAGRRLKCGDSC